MSARPTLPSAAEIAAAHQRNPLKPARKLNPQKREIDIQAKLNGRWLTLGKWPDTPAGIKRAREVATTLGAHCTFPIRVARD